MDDIKEQLAILRRKVSSIDKKYAVTAKAPTLSQTSAEKPSEELKPSRYSVEEWMSGKVVETPCGHHFETERCFELHSRHGSMDISSLLELPADLLDSISGGTIPDCPPEKWAFLDTETTGLAGGSGTYAFLVGVGRILPEGFRVKQFFMRDFGEEQSLLCALGEHLQQFDVLVTYNGKTYDQPLLETRFRMARTRPPFARMEHLDLLYGARRLWKLRFESCRLVELENQVLGVEREGDIPGAMIPHVYFEYLHTKQAFRLVPIFHHNAIDILTLACLTGIVPFAFRSPEEAPLSHGAEMVGLARWLKKAERQEQAVELLRRAVAVGLPDELLFPTLWETAILEKQIGRGPAALEIFNDLASSRNPYRIRALEELAKHCEHRERDYSRALAFTLQARKLGDSENLRRREQRLNRRIARPTNRKLL